MLNRVKNIFKSKKSNVFSTEVCEDIRLKSKRKAKAQKGSCTCNCGGDDDDFTAGCYDGGCGAEGRSCSCCYFC